MKRSLYSILVIFFIIIIFLLFSSIRKKENLQMVVIDEDYNASVVDFLYGTIKPLGMDIESYCEKNSKEIINVERKDDLYSVVLISKRGKNMILKTDMEIADTPVLIDEVLYFVAKDKSYTTEKFIPHDSYEGWFLYSYSNGNIKQEYANELDFISPIIRRDKTLYIVERNKNKKLAGKEFYSIISYDISTKESEFVCNGRRPCWIEAGEKFLCCVYNQNSNLWNVAVTVDIKTKKFAAFKENFEYSLPAVIKNSKMFYWDDDYTKPWLSEGTIPTIINLVSLEKVPVKEYQGLLDRLFTSPNIEDVFYKSIYYEWTE